MTVMSLRLGKEEMERIATLSKLEKKEKSVVARELLNDGWTLHWLKLYHDGRISLGKAAAQLDISISELMEMLADLGIETPLRFDDYVEGLGHLDKVTGSVTSTCSPQGSRKLLTSG